MELIICKRDKSKSENQNSNKIKHECDDLHLGEFGGLVLTLCEDILSLVLLILIQASYNF